MNRRKRQEELDRLFVKDEAGEYHYRGQWLTLPQPEQRRRLWRVLIPQMAVTLLVQLALVLIPAGPMQVGRVEQFNYVMLLFCLELLCGLAAVYNAGRLGTRRLCLREHESSQADWLSIFSLLAALSGVSLAIGQGIYLCTVSVAADRLWDVLMLLLALAAGVVNGLSWWCQRGLHWEMQDQPIR